MPAAGREREPSKRQNREELRTVAGTGADGPVVVMKVL
jgi:hypothetical protein